MKLDLNSTDLDCFDIVKSCELLTSILLESDNPAEHRAACKCLNICLEALEIAFEKPLSSTRIEQLTVEVLPEAASTYFYQDSQTLCQYCLALTDVLLTSSLKSSTEKYLAGLLFDLTDHMAEDLRSPRFKRNSLLH